MLDISSRLLARVEKLTIAAWPEEGCGLIVGRRSRGPGGLRWQARRIVPGINMAAHPGVRFEIDPRLQIRLQRQLRGTEEAVIGVYHSHPDGPAKPSDADLAMANDPGLLWLVVATGDGVSRGLGAFVPTADLCALVPLKINEGGR